MKAIVVNGSPRKDWNTGKAVQKAGEGLEDEGFEVERIDLYDYVFKGCTSCFACKLKNDRTNGICAMKDDLRPVLERLREADAVVLGSPVYFSQPLGQVRSFVERWLFPVYSYHYEDGKPVLRRGKEVPCGMIFTMNLTKEVYDEWGYAEALKQTPKSMAEIMGYCETLNIYDTYQFKDYSRYDVTLFDEEKKRRYRDSHFETDLKNAYDLGRRIAERAKRASERRDSDLKAGKVPLYPLVSRERLLQAPEIGVVLPLPDPDPLSYVKELVVHHEVQAVRGKGVRVQRLGYRYDAEDGMAGAEDRDGRAARPCEVYALGLPRRQQAGLLQPLRRTGQAAVLPLRRQHEPAASGQEPRPLGLDEGIRRDVCDEPLRGAGSLV
jgi:multimeric flavodoxin WrbA